MMKKVSYIVHWPLCRKYSEIRTSFNEDTNDYIIEVLDHLGRARHIYTTHFHKDMKFIVECIQVRYA